MYVAANSHFIYVLQICIRQSSHYSLSTIGVHEQHTKDLINKYGVCLLTLLSFWKVWSILSTVMLHNNVNDGEQHSWYVCKLQQTNLSCITNLINLKVHYSGGNGIYLVVWLSSAWDISMVPWGLVPVRKWF